MIVLLRRYNAPALHKDTCRHVARFLDKKMCLTPATASDFEGARDGWIKVCGTCKPEIEVMA